MADTPEGWTCVCADGPCSEFPCKSHAPERTLPDEIVDDWYNKLVEYRARIAALEQEREDLIVQIFRLHEIQHTYYGPCRCETCDKYRALTEGENE